MIDPNAAYDARQADLMKVSATIALQRLAAAREAQQQRAQERREAQALASLAELDPFYFADSPRIEKAAGGPSSEQFAELLDLLREVVERPPVVHVQVPDTIAVSSLPERQKKTILERDERGKATSSTCTEKDCT